MSRKQNTFNEILSFTLGELIIAALTVAGGLVLSLAGVISFDYKIITGAALGFAVIVANYTMLSVSVNRAIGKYMELRGSGEMDDEMAEQFAKDNSRIIQNAITRSFVTRTVSMVAALVIAFLTGWFNPLATAIPMFAFRPLLTVIELIRKKYDKKPDPDKFIRYDYDDEDEDEKESD